MATKRSSSSDKKVDKKVLSDVLSDDHVAVAKGDESDVVVGPPRRRSVAGFLVKIYDIFNDSKHAEYCGWGENGDSIIVHKMKEFASEVLPQYFKTSNFHSFCRQLNMYGFTKVHADPHNGEFMHTYFRRGRKDLLFLIFRKGAGAGKKPKNGTGSNAGSRRKALQTPKDSDLTSTSTSQLTPANELPTAAPAPTIDSPLDPPSLVHRQQSDQILNNLCDLRVAHQSLINRVTEMERKQLSLSCQNSELWRKLQESRASQEELQSKFQRVVYFMYDMFLSAGGKVRVVTGNSQDNPPISASPPSTPSHTSISTDISEGQAQNQEQRKNRADLQVLNSFMESLNAPVTAMPDIQYASEMKFLDLEAPIPAPINDASETPPMMIDPSRAPVASKIGLDIRKVTSTSKRPLPPSPSLLPSSKKSKLYNVEDPRITELQNMAIDARVTNLEGDIASIKAGEKMVSKNLEDLEADFVELFGDEEGGTFNFEELSKKEFDFGKTPIGGIKDSEIVANEEGMDLSKLEDS
ncbi:hypothetical protein TrVE_jg1877 [Triparma verrucosa]|uniref:HSF-type DNA-binding domain-containing protein n=1 Tax=Triparma verrucosa TaxID=1606542 RepID=A0A9W7BTH6_9STRA|nr:hypothetical protein TrVE_jg1877 [Triparma verrucosa]